MLCSKIMSSCSQSFTRFWCIFFLVLSLSGCSALYFGPLPYLWPFAEHQTSHAPQRVATHSPIQDEWPAGTPCHPKGHP